MTRCAEVLSVVPTARAALPQAKVVRVDERVEGFFLERLTDRGEPVGTTQHDTMDEAMWQAYSEYVLSDWTSCPDDVDPLEYIRAQST
jgi:hypothetical protein